MIGEFLVYDEMENISMDGISIYSRKLSRQKFHNELAVYSLPHYASKNADRNQQQLTDGGILANRNGANHSYCFLSNQKKVQILAFFACDPTNKCILPSFRERHKGLMARGHDLRLEETGHPFPTSCVHIFACLPLIRSYTSPLLSESLKKANFLV